jgi:hypothetical protein
VLVGRTLLDPYSLIEKSSKSGSSNIPSIMTLLLAEEVGGNCQTKFIVFLFKFSFITIAVTLQNQVYNHYACAR